MDALAEGASNSFHGCPWLLGIEIWTVPSQSIALREFERAVSYSPTCGPGREIYGDILSSPVISDSYRVLRISPARDELERGSEEILSSKGHFQRFLGLRSRDAASHEFIRILGPQSA